LSLREKPSIRGGSRREYPNESSRISTSPRGDRRRRARTAPPRAAPQTSRGTDVPLPVRLRRIGQHVVQPIERSLDGLEGAAQGDELIDRGQEVRHEGLGGQEHPHGEDTLHDPIASEAEHRARDQGGQQRGIGEAQALKVPSPRGYSWPWS
jgi:hypothetical protein